MHGVWIPMISNKDIHQSTALTGQASILILFMITLNDTLNLLLQTSILFIQTSHTINIGAFIVDHSRETQIAGSL